MNKKQGWPEPMDFEALSKIEPTPPGERGTGFYFDITGDWITVTWGGYEYDIELKRIPTPLALLQWIAHLGPKGWVGMTADEVAAFIEKVCRRKGWDLWGRDY